ncbi:hypothetical protein TSMEX_011561 [Taenia solium]|eukprot:TsM_000937200 transcript=TsM_000937200 gene=TsM_000937200
MATQLMSRNILPSNNGEEIKEEEEREDQSTLVAALADLPTSKMWQKVPLILHALPQELFLAAIDAGVTADSDIDHCREIPSQLKFPSKKGGQLGGRSIPSGSSTTNHHCKAPCCEDQRSQLVGRGCDQEASGTPPDTGAKTPSRQTPRAGEAYYLLCQSPNASRPLLQILGKLEGYLCRFLIDSGAVKSSVNFKAFPALHHKFCAGPSSIKLPSAEGRKIKAIGKTSFNVAVGKETWTVQFIICPELVWDVMHGEHFLRKTKAILNFAEGTFTTQQYKTTNSVESSPGKDAGEICSALFEAAGISVNNLDEFCLQLTHHRQRNEGIALIAGQIFKYVRLAKN